jgi:YVTN family beta-propeller protein
VQVAADGKRAYVSNKDDHSISVVDLDTLSVTRTITDPRIKDPEGFRAGQGRQEALRALSSKNAVGILSTDTHELLKEIPTGERPTRMTLSPDGKTLWVANDQGGSVTAIDTVAETAAPALKVGWQPRGVAVSPDGQDRPRSQRPRRTRSPSWTRPSARVVRNVGLHFAPSASFFSPDGLMVFITGRGTESLYVVDMRNNKRRMVRTIAVGRQPNASPRPGRQLPVRRPRQGQHRLDHRRARSWR